MPQIKFREEVMPEENEDPTKLLKLVELAQKKASYFKDLESRAF